MHNFVILTDSSCDLTGAMVEQLELEVLPLSVTVEEDTYKNYPDEREITAKTFYDKIREGKKVFTSAVNTQAFTDTMEPLLQQGKDILYIGFSSELSGTYSAGAAAARELQEKYPARRIMTVDSLCASMGQGLLVYLSVLQKRLGKTIEEVKKYAEEIKLKVCHWFTVEDLSQLRKGGRVSAASALVGNILNIKPVMHVDDQGKLAAVSKVRGRKASIRTMFENMGKTIEAPDGQSVFISHGDCEKEAKTLGDMIREKWSGIHEIIYNNVGPVIGAHTGPGVIALFYLGKHR